MTVRVSWQILEANQQYNLALVLDPNMEKVRRPTAARASRP